MGLSERIKYNYLCMQSKKSTVPVYVDSQIKNVLPHEMHSALALGKAGYEVRFLAPRIISKTADAYVNGVLSLNLQKVLLAVLSSIFSRRQRSNLPT